MKHLVPFVFMSCLTMAVGCGSQYGNTMYPTTYGNGQMAVAVHLTDGVGRALYEYVSDVAGSGISNCTTTNGCITAWPSVPGGTMILATGGGMPKAASISMITRANPSGSQATYNGKPLYYYEYDTAAGMTTGTGIQGWTLVAP